MRRHILFIILILLVIITCPAPVQAAGGNLCLDAIANAEAGRAIPKNVLSAIAHVESGRRDEKTRGFAPWPWTINAEGKGYFFKSKREAIAAVKNLQKSGMRSIDVGCMQVNLHHHKQAFASLDEAFDPKLNVAYAARYLRGLYNDSQSWSTAIGNYHSATPEFHYRYREKVMASLKRLDGKKSDAGVRTAVYRGNGNKPATKFATAPVENVRYTKLTIFEADAQRRAAVMAAWEERKKRQTRIASR